MDFLRIKGERTAGTAKEGGAGGEEVRVRCDDGKTRGGLTEGGRVTGAGG